MNEEASKQAQEITACIDSIAKRWYSVLEQLAEDTANVYKIENSIDYIQSMSYQMNRHINRLKEVINNAKA
jgi:hypothetical protein